MARSRTRSGACIAAALALCGVLACTGHHRAGAGTGGREEPSEGGRGGAAAGRGGGPTATAGESGAPPEPRCAQPRGECFTVVPIAEGRGLLLAGDINGDAAAELIVPGAEAAGTWYELDRTPAPHPLERSANGLVAYADVTGDGFADEVSFDVVACGDCDDPLVLQLAEGDGLGGFGEPESGDICPVGFSHWAFWLADLNGDGDSEYLLDARCGDDPKQLRLFDRPFADWQKLGVSVNALATGDIDGDSRADIVAVEFPSQIPPRLIVLRGEGGLRFSASPITAQLTGQYGRAVQILDLDGDGGRDVAVLVSDGDAQTWLATFRWTAGGLERVQSIPLDAFVHQIDVANTDADCGEELIAFAPKTDKQPMALLEVEPATGETRALQLPVPPPELLFVLSVPDAARRAFRYFANTADRQLVELAPSSCGPPTE